MCMNSFHQFLVLETELVKILEAAKGRCENKGNVAIAHNVGGNRTRPGFESFVRHSLEAHAGHIERGSLLRVANIPLDVIVTSI